MHSILKVSLLKKKMQEVFFKMTGQFGVYVCVGGCTPLIPVFFSWSFPSLGNLVYA